MRRRVGLVAFAALVAVAAACGDGDDDASETTTTAGPIETATTVPPAGTGQAGTTAPPITTAAPSVTAATVAPTAPPTEPTDPRPQVGTVLQVVTPGGDVDGRIAEGGTPILRAGVVTTEAAGKINFEVSDKLDQCILRAQGQAVVVPGDGPLVRLVRGEATCRTRPGGGSIVIAAGGAQVEVSDPVFRLVLDGGDLSNVSVAQGAVSVNGELLVGGQQATYAPGAGLGPREAVVFDEDMALLGEQLPPVVYEQPGGGESVTADSARGRGALVVRVAGSDGGAHVELSRRLLEPLGAVLGVPVDVAAAADPPDVVAGSLGEDVDVMVTNTPVDGLPTATLYELGGAWYAQAAPGDGGFERIVNRYLAGILQGPCPGGPGPVEVQAGDPVCYVTEYAGALGQGIVGTTVPLDRFAPLLGL